MQTSRFDYPLMDQQRRYVLLAVIWSVLVVGSLAWDISNERQSTLRTATSAASAHINKDISFRKWANSHGGVYVPPTEHTPPNPYLKVPDRDVVTTTGKALTLMNPAYVLREMQTDFPDDYGTKSHITSLKLLNPKNAPDDWELKALRSFEQGAKEYLGTQQIDGKPYLRLMRPFSIDRGCLKCHEQQGYKLGDIRGGISAAILLEPHLAYERALNINMAISHGAIWLIGLTGLGFSYRRDRRRADEREKATNDLRESKNQLRLLLDSAAEAIYGIDMRGNCTFCNPSCLRMLGYQRTDELIGKNMHELIHYRHADETPYPVTDCRIYRAFLSETNSHADDEVFWRADDTCFPVEYWSYPQISGGIVVGAVVTFMDITERKQAEDLLRNTQSLLNETQHITKVGGWEYDVTAHKVIWTDEVYRIHAVSKDFDPSNPKQNVQFYTPDDQSKIDHAFQRAIDKSEPYDLELQLINAQGIRLWVRTIGQAEQKNGEVVRVFGNIMDITEHKQIEEEIRRLNAELEQRVVERTAKLEAANKDMESFSYSISHDLRAPLRAINGFSKILQEEYADHLDDEGKRLLNVVASNAHKMGDLIDDILAFSRVGRNEIGLSVIDMKKLVMGVWEELKPDMAGRDIRLDMRDIPPAEGDPAMIHQVIFNLLSNAIKFTQHRADARIEVGGHADEHETVCHVKDNGVGFDMQYAPKLFGVFQRLHGMDEFEGTGIGLAIVKRIITKHGGRVWAEGKANEGATIYFALPNKEKIS